MQKIDKYLTKPKITVSPPGGVTLVTLPTIFSATRLSDVALPIANPVPGSISATPEYEWDFGDGLTGVGPGTPYEPGVLPQDNPGTYLTAAYAQPGTKTAQLRVTWRVTFKLEDVLDVELAPIVFTATTQTQVKTATNQLYARWATGLRSSWGATSAPATASTE